MRKRLKPGVLFSAREHRVRGYQADMTANDITLEVDYQQRVAESSQGLACNKKGFPDEDFKSDRKLLCFHAGIGSCTVCLAATIPESHLSKLTTNFCFICSDTTIHHLPLVSIHPCLLRCIPLSKKFWQNTVTEEVHCSRNRFM